MHNLSQEELRGALIGKLCGMLMRDELSESYDRGFFEGIRWVAEEVLGIDDVDAVVSDRVDEMRKEIETYII